MARPGRPIATHAGLRGRPGIELTPAVVTEAVGGLVALLRERGLPSSLAVARDGRPGGRRLAGLVVDSALAAGADVVDLGAVSTPAAKLAARLRGLGGAVVVTGSHLEPEWNGLKLVCAPRYVPVDARTLPPAPAPAPGSRGRVRADAGAASEHAAAVWRSVDVEAVRSAGFRVEWDGGVEPSAGMVLEGLGCRPGPHCDLGLRLDPDGDRVQLVDERGMLLDSEVVLPLAVLACAARTVVKGADTSRMVDDLLAEAGGTVQVVPPGELHLVDAMAESGGDLAGEGNGGVVIPAVGMARDGLAAAAAILGLLARARRPLSALAAGLPRYERRRSTVGCPGDEQARAALERLAARLGTAAPERTQDGIPVERNGTWGLVRQSATEPVLRVTVEARTAAEADALHEELRAGLLGRARPS